MKLYATTTSERASKGQGGNTQVEILMTIDPIKRVEVGRIIMKAEEDGYTIKYYPICGASFRAINDQNVIVLLDTTRGKKQKDDSGKDGICVACRGKNPEGCTYC